MTTYEYITKRIGKERFDEHVRAGIISMNLKVYLQIYEWHMSNGRKRNVTAEHFKVSNGLVGYAVYTMRREVNV